MTTYHPVVVFIARQVPGEADKFFNWEQFGIGYSESETKAIGREILGTGNLLGMRKAGEGLPAKTSGMAG